MTKGHAFLGIHWDPVQEKGNVARALVINADDTLLPLLAAAHIVT